MASKRTIRIDAASLDQRTFDVTIVNRQASSGAAQAVDYAVAVGVVFVLGTLPGVVFFGDSQGPGIGFLLMCTLLAALVVSPMLAPAVRAIRSRFQSIKTERVTLDRGNAKDWALNLGDHTLKTGDVRAVALLGWQEVAATDRVWDVTLMLGSDQSYDVVSGHKSEDNARSFASALAKALDVGLKESSVAGGGVTQVQVKGQQGQIRWE